MEISCVLLSTAKRLSWLKKSIYSINSLDFSFTQKIVSIDEFDNHKISQEDIEEYKSQGWIVDVVSYKNKHKSLQKAIELCDSDYVFYTEDDIELIQIPKDISKILSHKDNGRKCGVLSMNLGGSKLSYPTELGDLPFWLSNVFYNENNLLSFIRLESEASMWFIEFPCVFFEKELIKNLLNTSTIPNNLIESSITEKYFKDNFQKDFFKASICFDSITDISNLLSNQKDVPFWNEKLESTKLYRLLDSNQGGANINLNEIKYVQ
jgi:hypothetical protein